MIRLVKFDDGTYGARSGWWPFYAFYSGRYWWRFANDVHNHAKHSLNGAAALYEKLKTPKPSTAHTVIK